ncbi:MAG: NAD(P)H-dependent glycerol-3-phosphate dehydrogenase [Mycoplasmatales bacterium]
MKIGVLGAGSFGCAIAQIASDNKHQVWLWSHHQAEVEKLEQTRENPYIKGAMLNEEIILTSELDFIKDVSLIVYVVPSFAVRSVTERIKPFLNDEQIFVICTKGIESETLLSSIEILERIYQLKQRKVILSGPTHAEEVALKKITTIVSTSEDKYAREVVQTVFSNNYLRVYTNADPKGVEILGATKNVLAIAAGVCDSKDNLGDNAKAALLTRGLAELVKIGEAEGAQTSTFYGLTGMGDLIVTATSQHSRNRKFGELLGKGKSRKEALDEIKMVVEGLNSVDAVYALMQKHNLNLPLITGIYEVLHDKIDIDTMLNKSFNRVLKDETEVK